MLNRSLIALDIGSSAVKLLELSGSTRRKLKSIGIEVIPSGAISDGVIQDEAVVEEAIRSVLEGSKVRAKNRRAAVSLGGSSVVIKRVGVTATRLSEVSQQVHYEAEQNGMDSTEMCVSYQTLSAAPDHTGRIPVVLAGARRDSVEQFMGILRNMGMRMSLVDCEVFSALNMFEYNYGITPSLIGVVNVGAATTQVSLVLGGQYMFAREVPIAGEEYSRQIMSAMGVDRDNAESLKMSASQGGSASPEIQKIIADLNEQLVSEIQMSLDYYFQNGEAPPNLTKVHAIYLTGGGARSMGLDTAVAGTLQVPVQVVNPFERISVSSKLLRSPHVSMQGHVYGVAVGLALRQPDDIAA